MKALILLSALLIGTTTGCGSSGTTTAGTTGSNSSPTGTPTGTRSSAGSSRTCDAIDTDVNALVAGTTSEHTDNQTGSFELCKWDSSNAPTLGMRHFFQATITALVG
jgi:hypothetical protein